ncbi:hypothetical protein [Propylenella binzhouense]|uniref:Flagellar FliJ protein n=1 Tax=Propylenella binzhouense TaxID=2555902 RepID=A0A964WSK0_9HYPH|nr:hypothetical protein [Propylenella binzhouense]MYZ46956.1 hypothetical protein [Propylenella binzhouense]
MADRLRQIRRMIAVQEELFRIAERKVADLEARRIANAEAQGEVLRALGAENALHGLFLEQASRRLAALSREGDRIVRETDEARAALLGEGRRLKQARRFGTALEDEERRRQEARELEDVIDRIAGGGSASLP